METDKKTQKESIIVSTLKVGAFAGAGGVLFGGTVSILRSSPIPVLFATVSGLQWALLASTFYGIRATYLSTRVLPSGASHFPPSTLTTASTLAGALSFASVGAVTRGRANVLPGTFVGTASGYSGQKVYNYYDERHTASLAADAPLKTPLIERILNSKYFPVKRISDEEYVGMLEEKLLRVRAEIAVLDDDLAQLGGHEPPKVEEKRTQKDSDAEEARRKAKRREG